MKILIGDKGNVDFSEPIKMSDEQIEKFVTFMKSLFSVVEIEHSNEVRNERVGARPDWPKEWLTEEYTILLEDGTTSEMAEKLGRTWMSVNIKNGSFIQEFLFWASEKGKDLVRGDRKKLIEEFLKEKQDLINKKRSEKKKIRNRLKEIEIELGNSEDARKTFEQIIKVGVSYLGISVDEARNQLKEIEKKKIKLSEERKKLQDKIEID
jgi:hypothetical protein